MFQNGNTGDISVMCVFFGRAPRHVAHRVQNLIWNKIKICFLIYMRIGRETRRGFKKIYFCVIVKHLKKNSFFNQKKRHLIVYNDCLN